MKTLEIDTHQTTGQVSLISTDTRMCWDCCRERPQSEMTKSHPLPGMTVWNCGCGRITEPAFMTVAAGQVRIHDGITGVTLPGDWTGVCVSGDNAKAFWNIGQDAGERSFSKLPIEVVTLKDALAAVKRKVGCQQVSPVSQAAISIWKQADGLGAVVCVREDIPAGLPLDWVIMNAPRPLLGDETAYGEFLTGRFYAAIDPDKEFAQNLIDRNVRDDARVVFVADQQLQEAMALETISPEYKAAYRKLEVQKRSNAMSPFVRKLNQGRSLLELRELARVAHDELQLEAAVRVAVVKPLPVN